MEKINRPTKKAIRNDFDDDRKVILGMNESVRSFESRHILFSKFQHSQSMKNLKKNESVNILFNIITIIKKGSALLLTLFQYRNQVLFFE